MNSEYNSNKIIEDISNMYPYGQFPDKYTKKNKEKDLNNPNIFNYTQPSSTTQKVEIESVKKEPARQSSDISKLIPLITSFKNNKKIDSSSMLDMFLPMLLGNKSKDITTLLKLFNSSKPQPQHNIIHTDFPKSNLPPIDSFERVE